MLSRAKRITGRQSAAAFSGPRETAGANVPSTSYAHATPRAPEAAPGTPAPFDAGRASIVTEQPRPRASTADIEREAFASGYAQGERAGFEAGAHRAEAMLRRLAATIEELTLLRRDMIAQSEREMVQLALAIARRIVHREVTIDQDLVVTIARVALERLGGKATATIRLHPDDYAAVVASHGESWAGLRVQVVADERVSRGGCQVESDVGFIDATIGAQFERIADELLEGSPGAADDVTEFALSRLS
jgi:flagellar assembly protein FliH